jgi:hypothetical protein
MHVQIFRSLADGGLYGFITVTSRCAPDLPKDKGPWEHWKSIDMNRGETIKWGIDTDEVLDAIDKNGFFVTKIRIRIIEQETDTPRP